MKIPGNITLTSWGYGYKHMPGRIKEFDAHGTYACLSACPTQVACIAWC